MKQPILFLDTETLGLDIAAPIWEVAVIKIDSYGTHHAWQSLVQHEADDWPDTLPASFREDYEKRYVTSNSYNVTGKDVIDVLNAMCADHPLVAGSNPGFDMQRIEQLAINNEVEPPAWHYHPFDVPTLAHGWLLGKGVSPAPPWKSDFISQACGVNPADYDRHTAMGDVKWCLDLFERITT